MTTKLSSKQYLRPSGIVASKDGKYYYWKCSISGTPTFSNAERFVKVVAQYGSEENLFKTFVCRDAKKLQKAGFTDEQIKQSFVEGKNLLDELPKKVKVENVRKPRVVKVVEEKVEVLQVVEDDLPKEVERIIYPWTNDPNYFTSPPTPLNIEETTAESCMYPNRYLDNACQGCSVYAQCKCSIKCTEDDWKSGKKKYEQPVKKAIQYNEAGEAI